MSLLNEALVLASRGFHVFPVVPGKKKPALIPAFPEKATTSHDQIRLWWGEHPEANIGISTTRFGENEALVAVDVDNKGEKRGDEEILKLEIQGFEFPETYTQVTPSGGRHYIYRTPRPVKQGVSVLGPGLDIRSRGGYVVGRGSRVPKGTYTGNDRPVAEAPGWLVARCGFSAKPDPKVVSEIPGIDRDTARERAFFYLNEEAPLAVEGTGGDHTTYLVAARIKDFGVTEDQAFELMASEWNDRCSPPWGLEDLRTKIANAYRYGVDPVGSSAPEASFTPIEEEDPTPHPFGKLNREFAFVIAGGGSHILWETRDPEGRHSLEHLGIVPFHQKLASHVMTIGDGKTKPVSELWMKSKERRSYDGICFLPGRESPPRFYNLWRGFAVDPLPSGEEPTSTMREGLDAFLDHGKNNICRGDESLFHWLMGYFAHLVQRPWEKPLTALVFRGGKGVGKNALVDRIGHLLGGHYLVASDRRYLVGNFNSHMESTLLFALDEAFWSGDKQAEGVLKSLITGKEHLIEHKGKEPYKIANLTRVVIIGNEDWLVPASQDERRFAVFDVGDGRKQDRDYFLSMRLNMERGAYRYLLRYLLDFDYSDISVDEAPKTEALHDQKNRSLDPFYQWWLQSLHEGKLVSAGFSSEWPREIDKEIFRQGFRVYCRERHISARIPDDRYLGRLLRACLPSADFQSKRREGSERINTYRFPSLTQGREEWEKFIGHTVKWDTQDDNPSK